MVILMAGTHVGRVGFLMSFMETFGYRIGKWVDQNIEGVAPDEIDASGADALKVQAIIEAIIKSWETGQIVTPEA